MTREELKEIFECLIKDGLTPLLCDTELPRNETQVMCGEPNIAYGDIVESELWPRELLSMNPEFVIPVRGDSMIDAGIEEGDMVKVISDNVYQDGDILLVSIDGACTLKTYCEDEDGNHWLVPQNDRNEKYKPFMLDGLVNVRIFGRVKQVLKKAPRIAYKKCMKAIHRFKRDSVKMPEITPQKVSRVIREVAVMVKKGRHWYAVYRVLVDFSVTAENDFEGFCERIRQEVPRHEHLPSVQEMQRMAILSFSKPVSKWDPNNAPVKGKLFTKYQQIARRTQELMAQE